MEPSRHDIEFESHGATLRGWLYLPDGDGPHPGVVMAHGLSAVREMFLDRYATAFARAGIATLAYDHFGFGASDGEPRQWPSPTVQLQGYRDGIACLADRARIDAGRIGIWGSSFSGGEVIILASEDLPIACAVAQVPGLGEGEGELPEATLAPIMAAFENGDADATVPAVRDDPDGLGIMFEDGAADWFTRVAAERAPTWRNEIRVSAFADPYRPIDHLADAKVPLRLIVAPADEVTPPAPARSLAASVDAVDVVEIPGGHFDAYESGFEASSGAAIEWFTRHLGLGADT